MALQYCKTCGVLIANAKTADAVCDRCLAAAPPKVQFTCPSCRSLLQLPPVAKRTKVKCPKCAGDFTMHPDGKIEPRQGGAQSALIDDLKVKGDLGKLLENVPQKASVLPSVLDSDRYESYRDDSGELPSSDEAPADVIIETPTADDAPVDLAPEAQPEPERGNVPQTESRAIAAAQRARETRRRQKKVLEERAVRAAEAQRHTVKFVEKRTRRVFAVVKLALLVAFPLLAGLVFLASTTQENGFAGRPDAPLARRLADLGDTVRQGVLGWQLLVTGK